MGIEDVWDNGQRLHPARTDSLTFLTGFVDYGQRSTPEGPLFGTPMTFLVLARNTSSKAVTLDPMHFSLHAPGSGITLAPLDPETEIRAAARNLADGHGRHLQGELNDAVFEGSIALLDLFVDKTPQEKEESRREREERREMREEEARDHANAMREAAARRDRWAGQALRKTTLLPGMRAQGTVSFVQNAANLYPDTLVLRYGPGGLPAGFARKLCQSCGFRAAYPRIRHPAPYAGRRQPGRPQALSAAREAPVQPLSIHPFLCPARGRSRLEASRPWMGTRNPADTFPPAPPFSLRNPRKFPSPGSRTELARLLIYTIRRTQTQLGRMS